MTSSPDVEYNVSFDRLKPHPNNPNTGNVDLIRRSIRTNGFIGVIVAQKSTGFILAGHHRVLALKAEEYEDVPVVQWVDVDDATARRILVVDNRASDMRTGYDDDALQALLVQIAADDEAGLSLVGYSDKELERLTKLVEGDVSSNGGSSGGGGKSLDDLLASLGGEHTDADNARWDPTYSIQVPAPVHEKLEKLPQDTVRAALEALVSE
jgi:hypothetical protein